MTRRALLILILVLSLLIVINEGRENERLKAELRVLKAEYRITSAHYYGLKEECYKRHLMIVENGWDVKVVRIEL